MPKVALVGDKTVGHSGHDPLTIITGSDRMKVGGVKVAIVGSTTTPGHNQTQTITTGNSRIKIGGVPVAVIGSQVSCGDVVATGSGRINIGG